MSYALIVGLKHRCGVKEGHPDYAKPLNKDGVPGQAPALFSGPSNSFPSFNGNKRNFQSLRHWVGFGKLRLWEEKGSIDRAMRLFPKLG